MPAIRGIYFDTRSDPGLKLPTHVVRIAHYLHLTACRCSASASGLASATDGRLFIDGRRNQLTRRRRLEFVQTQAPQPSPFRQPSQSSDFCSDVNHIRDVTISVLFT